MSDLTYNVGILKSAETITGITGCKSFQGEDSQGFYHYAEPLNVFVGQSIVLIDSDSSNYDYMTIGMQSFGVRSSWLDSISTEVYWNQVSIDAEVEVSNNNVDWIKRHFSRYDEDSPDSKPYYVFVAGKTSHTADVSQEVIEIDCSSATASSVAGKYFFIYSDDEAFYIWFDVNNSETDPNPASPGGQPLTEIEVNLNSGDIADVIATKLRAAIAAQTDFSAIIESNTKVIVTVTNPGFVYDSLPGDSGLSVSITTQGGGEESFQYARLTS